MKFFKCTAERNLGAVPQEWSQKQVHFMMVTVIPPLQRLWLRGWHPHPGLPAWRQQGFNSTAATGRNHSGSPCCSLLWESWSFTSTGLWVHKSRRGHNPGQNMCVIQFLWWDVLSPRSSDSSKQQLINLLLPLGCKNQLLFYLLYVVALDVRARRMRFVPVGDDLARISVLLTQDSSVITVISFILTPCFQWSQSEVWESFQLCP